MFSIETDQIAFIAFNENPIPTDIYTLSIYYLDSKRGYKEGDLSIWQRMPTKAEIKEVPYDLSFAAKLIKIDQNLGFNRIAKK